MEYIAIIMSGLALGFVVYDRVTRQLFKSKTPKALNQIIELSAQITEKLPANLKETLDLLDRKSSKALLGVATIVSVLIKTNNKLLEDTKGLTEEEKSAVQIELNNISNSLIEVTDIQLLSTHIWIVTKLGVSEIDRTNFSNVRTGLLGEFVK